MAAFCPAGPLPMTMRSYSGIMLSSTSITPWSEEKETTTKSRAHDAEASTKERA